MEVLEKKDLLKLQEDSFVKSVLIPKGIFTPNSNLKRGNLLIMCPFKIQQIRFQVGASPSDHKLSPFQFVQAEYAISCLCS